MPEQAITFGDNVRVRDTRATREFSLAGATGQVLGHTTPSMMGVEVIGQLTSDFALNVHFNDLGRSFWFAPDLLELIDHAPGLEIRLYGVPKRWIRQADGSWAEESPTDSGRSRPWWKFW